MSRNVPALCAGADCVFKLICPFQDGKALAASAELQTLRETLPVEFVIQPPVEFDGYLSNYQRYSGYYNRVLSSPDLRLGSTVFVLLTPDGIYGNGSFARARELCEQGYGAVLIPGPRVVKETFLQEYQSALASANGTPDIGNRALVQMFLRHPQRITKSFLVSAEEGYFNTHPAHLYWRVKDEGYIYRSFVCHPLLLRPDREFNAIETTLDHILVPEALSSLDKVYVCTDSEEIFGVDMASAIYDQNTISYKRHSEQEVKQRISQWLNSGWPTAYHIWQASHEGRIHTGAATAEWHDVSRASEALFADVLRAEGIPSVEQMECLRDGKLCDAWLEVHTGISADQQIPRGFLRRFRRTLPGRLLSVILNWKDKQLNAAIRTVNVVLAERIEASNKELGKMLSDGKVTSNDGHASSIEAQEALAYAHHLLAAQTTFYRKQLRWMVVALLVLVVTAAAMAVTLFWSTST